MKSTTAFAFLIDVEQVKLCSWDVDHHDTKVFKFQNMNQQQLIQVTYVWICVVFVLKQSSVSS